MRADSVVSADSASPIDHDIAYWVAICGAGPAGAALALLLAETADAADILLIDARAAADAARDPRTIAISHGSRIILERVGAWRDDSATPIRHIHVSQRGRFGRTLIDGADYGVPALGYVVRYGDLVLQLNQAVARRGIAVRRPATVSAMTGHADHVVLTLNDVPAGPDHPDVTLRARYAVHAEGGLFGQQAVQPRHRDYGQTAVTAFVTCTRPQSDVAWERFTEDGPIALLPSRDHGVAGYALVWCCRPDDAERHLALDDDAFLDALHAAFGDRVGRFTQVRARHAWPLGLNAVGTLAQGREFAIGNAAQTLHPVAGQGMNLALRDACELARALRLHGDDAAACARAYNQARRIDRAVTIRLTDMLPRLFASPLEALALARGAALALLDLVPPARHVLARQMMNGQRGGHT